MSYYSQLLDGILGSAKQLLDDNFFSNSKRFIVPANPDVVEIIFDPSELTKEYLILLPIVLSAYDAGPIEVDAYMIDSYTGGTEQSGNSRNFVIGSTPECKVVLNPTTVVNEVKLPPEWYIFSEGLAAAVSVGGTATEDYPFMLDPSKIYMLRLSNINASTGYGAYQLNWYEYTPENPEK